jgi:anti-sigma regulatory factor (Ser/Thr protein kinase)
MGDAFLLELPPVAMYLGTARTFSAQIARHVGCDDGTVEDVKLAVSEACAGSVRPAGAGEPVVVRSTLGADIVAFEIEGTGDLTSDRSSEGPARLDLIRTLFPDTSLVTMDGRTTVRFTLPFGG